jgi:hypothetical protein
MPGDLDLSRIVASPSSAFVPLAASLYLAASGGTPKPNVFSTGSWKGQGIEGVTGIADKVTAVMSASADKPILFVPHANLNEAELAAGDRATITAFRSGGTDLKTCLQPLLAKLLAPPAPNASLDEKLDYANNDFIVNDRQLRDDYYCNHLVEPLSQRLRPQIDEGCIDPIRRIAACIGLSRTGTMLLGRVTHGMKRFFFVFGKVKRHVEQICGLDA